MLRIGWKNLIYSCPNKLGLYLSENVSNDVTDEARRPALCVQTLKVTLINASWFLLLITIFYEPNDMNMYFNYFGIC